mmetsp:Transcript_13599/g.29956  ORF Transcript_13599/g.29956 Transcript_13599/m.29956 type:complete len:236 (+) Transcript_13599:166-873(+)
MAWTCFCNNASMLDGSDGIGSSMDGGLLTKTVANGTDTAALSSVSPQMSPGANGRLPLGSFCRPLCTLGQVFGGLSNAVILASVSQACMVASPPRNSGVDGACAVSEAWAGFCCWKSSSLTRRTISRASSRWSSKIGRFSSSSTISLLPGSATGGPSLRGSASVIPGTGAMTKDCTVEALARLHSRRAALEASLSTARNMEAKLLWNTRSSQSLKGVFMPRRKTPDRLLRPQSFS